jgi:acyl carrier protein
MMHRSPHADTIRAFVAKYIRDANIGDDDDMFAGGFVNSLFALQLVSFLEREFKIVIENADLELANFTSIQAMGALIDRKRSLAST